MRPSRDHSDGVYTGGTNDVKLIGLTVFILYTDNVSKSQRYIGKQNIGTN